MRNKNNRGFISFDFLFSIIPILLIVSYTITFSSALEQRTDSQLSRQLEFDKLVSASDYVVRSAAAEKIGSGFPEAAAHPNLVNSEDFSALSQALGERLRINLTIGFEEAGFNPEGTCIYRLVVYKPTGEIRKLYFCD